MWCEQAGDVQAVSAAAIISVVAIKTFYTKNEVCSWYIGLYRTYSGLASWQIAISYMYKYIYTYTYIYIYV